MKNNFIFICILIFSMSCSSLPAFCQQHQTPVVYIIGDSTVKNGQDKGDRNQWGWGRFLPLWFKNEYVKFENHAIGGRSSRSFIREGRWETIKSKLKKGDFVLIQFGHNDGGELNSGRARASLKGIGDEYQDIVYHDPDDKALEGKTDRVYTYGYYLRQYIQDVKDKGAVPIICSPIPRNRWENNKVIRDKQYAFWAGEVAKQENICFLDLHSIIADKYDVLGEVIVADFFSEDHTHTSLKGAMFNAKLLSLLINQQKKCKLRKYLIPYDYNQK